MSELTLGSLFSGSGGFELGGKLAGIKSIWASEIEPFPMAVTRKNFPELKHLGDICKVNGNKIEPVDIITFGSNCQNFSQSGDKTGLKGSKSSLFFEAIRIIKEMRAKTNGRYPRYAVFENVRGVLWCSNGEDFRRILNEFCSIVRPDIVIPKPEKWNNSGVIMGDGFSIAWRLFDASGWGVPQRRKRIYLVADFAGNSAVKILFESEGLRWNLIKGREPWKGYTRCSEESTGETGGRRIDALTIESHPQDSRVKIKEDNICQTLATNTGTGGNNVPLVAVPVDSCYDVRITTNGTCKASSRANIYQTDTSRTIEARVQDPDSNYGGVAIVHKDYSVRRLTPTECSRLQGFPDGWCDNLGLAEITEEDMNFWRKVFNEYAEISGKKAKTDSQIRKWLSDPYNEQAEYRMWGNGVALPNVYYVLSGIAEYNKDTK